tara:strand:+ start:68 stop:364 length:297 start_codon:yes stop_codon:yes gene_type:complete
MPFAKGNKLSKGRPPGKLNRTTEMMKLSVARGTNKVLDNLPQILEDLMEKDPKGAVDIALKLLEFHLPKQSRVEVRGEIEAKIQSINININKNDGTND